MGGVKKAPKIVEPAVKAAPASKAAARDGKAAVPSSKLPKGRAAAGKPTGKTAYAEPLTEPDLSHGTPVGAKPLDKAQYSEPLVEPDLSHGTPPGTKPTGNRG